MPKDMGLVFYAVCWLVYYDIQIRARSLPHIFAMMRKMAGGLNTARPVENAEETLDKLWRACGFWMGRVLGSNRPCLRRALVMQRWCIRNGLNSKVVVGVGKVDGQLKGHAWILIEGRVYKEDPAMLEQEYVVMLEG